MKRSFFVVGALAWISASVLAANGVPARAVVTNGAKTVASLVSPGKVQQAPATAQAAAASAAGSAQYRAMLDRYCVGCHNERTNLPAARPLLLNTADVADPSKDPALWEKVIVKLSVGAMPPQG